MAEAAEEQSAPPPKRSKLPLMIIIGAVVLLNAVILGKVFLGGSGKKGKKAPQVAEVGAKMPLDDFLVNLAGSSDHYLKATVALGLRKDVTEESMKDEVAPVRDAIVSVLSSQHLEDLGSEAGKERLKRELRERIDRELGSEKVVRVYFTSFATQ